MFDLTSTVIQAAAEAELSWPAVEGWDDDKLELTLGTSILRLTLRDPSGTAKHAHLTLQLIWEEYRVAQPEGYRYSRFCDLYREWLHKRDVVLRQQHRAGEKLFVDYAGDTIAVYSGTTGEPRRAVIFVAVLVPATTPTRKLPGRRAWTTGLVPTYEPLSFSAVCQP